MTLVQMKYTANLAFLYLRASAFARVGKPQYLAVDCRGTFGVSNPADGLEGGKVSGDTKGGLDRLDTLLFS